MSIIDFSVPLESINVIDKAAQEAIRLSASRIEVLPCKWDGCDVVTNCPQTLINHLEKSHKSHRAHFTCLWTQCGRRCHQNENHLEKHASIPYRCAYKGCTETFRSGSTLLKHFRRYHKGGELKPSARPVAMGLKPIPKTPTEPLPAYLCLSRVAQPTPITSKQHASLGPWVLRNINESDTSQTWQKKKTNRYNESTPGGNPGADYEYLITRTLRPSSYLSTPAHVELADIGMNSEFYEGQRYDESLTIFNRRQPGEDEVEELNSPNSPLFGLNAKAKEVIDISQDHDEGDG
ncbi:hypothetical protein BJ165DRAFT_1424049 [Panaeolus papilionaceus]|nr:hypothetical protein BJ165DRAFT_1424049 [Panaeolus papilionaceus]